MSDKQFIMMKLTRKTLANLDRKSTRLNSSHPSISYAVFCLKKKKIRCSLATVVYVEVGERTHRLLLCGRWHRLFSVGARLIGMQLTMFCIARPTCSGNRSGD